MCVCVCVANPEETTIVEFIIEFKSGERSQATELIFFFVGGGKKKINNQK